MKQVNTTLFALNKDGSFQEWKVFVDGGEVIVEFGKLGGKIQRKSTYCEPKNVGRSNETTDVQQAVLEAKAKWEKQVRLGYRETTQELETEENFSVMLAADAIKRKNAIDYPCYVQPKLDGLRCLITYDKAGNPVFNSRGNKTYPIKGLIVTQLQVIRLKTNKPMQDGEIYLKGLSLQKITSLAKKWRTHADIAEELQKDFVADNKRRDKAIKEGLKTYKDFDGVVHDISVVPELDINRYGGYESADLQFHIFDVPHKEKIWYTGNGDDRFTDLVEVNQVVVEENLSHIEVVKGGIFHDEKSVIEQIAIHMQNGYEGDIIRNFKGRYEFGQRSTDLQKWKIFQTAEGLVVSYVIDKNDEAVLDVRLKNSIMFSCKMKGTFKDRNETAAKRLINKFITFSFQTYTDGGVPQFPVGLAVRDVNPVTWEPNN